MTLLVLIEHVDLSRFSSRQEVEDNNKRKKTQQRQEQESVFLPYPINRYVYRFDG